jgi:hypothetical protein
VNGGGKDVAVTTTSAVSLSSTGSYNYSRNSLYCGGGASISDVDEDSEDDDNEDSDSEDGGDDSSLEDLPQQGGGGGTVMGIQAWPGRRSLYDDFAGVVGNDDKTEEEDDANKAYSYDNNDDEDDDIERLAASHLLLANVFRQGGSGAGRGGGGETTGNHNMNHSHSNPVVVRVVSSDEDDEGDEVRAKEVKDADDDDAALAEQWERQLRQNYQKEQQWQRLLAAMGDTNANGKGGKALDLSTIVEEEDDGDGDTESTRTTDHESARSGRKNDRRLEVFHLDELLAFDDHVLGRLEDRQQGTDSSSTRCCSAVESERNLALAEEQDDGGVEVNGVVDSTDSSSSCSCSAQFVAPRTGGPDAHEPTHINKDDRSQLWLQLPAILPRIQVQADPHYHGRAAAGTAQGDVDAHGATAEPVPRPPVELLQKTLDCIAALAFCG